MTTTPPVALTIAGFDGSAGAGVGADWKTFAAHGVYGIGAVTALTCQNTRGVASLELVAPALLARQLAALAEDFRPAAVKIGMLGGGAQVREISRFLASLALPVVLDPVLASQHGDELLDADGRVALRGLLPQVAVLTPNLDEAASLLERERSEIEAEPRAACEALAALGPRAIVLKGGHADGRAFSEDALWDGAQWHTFRVPRVETRNDHGTGCTFSAALCARLSRGETLESAVRGAQSFVHAALEGARAWQLGRGRGPLRHFHAREPFPP